MSENEKNLREWVTMVAEHTPRIRASGLRLLDALLAEHRAEVERLTRQVDEARQMLSTQHDVSGCVAMHIGLRPEHICTLDHMQAGKASARDAALEEALDIVRRRLEWQGQTPVGDEIRTLKSQPARRYVDAEKVREAAPTCPGADCPMCSGEVCGACGAGATRRPALDGIPCEHDVIDRHSTGRPGVDPDADGETRPTLCECGHEVGWHWDGKGRGCMKKLPESGNVTCPCKSWSPQEAS